MMAMLARVTIVFWMTAQGSSIRANPIQKVLQMIGHLEEKIIGEGKELQRMYDEFSEFCEDQSKELHHEVKTSKAEIETLHAAIKDADVKVEALETKVQELGSSVAGSEEQLKEATKIREGERANFLAEEKELVESVGAIERASGILEAQLNGGASFAQVQGATGVIQVLSAMTAAHGLNSADAARLTALVQSSTGAEDNDEAMGAPAAAATEGQSGGILDTLETLLSKTQDQLSSVRDAETKALEDFELLKQSLKDDMKYASKDMEDAKKSIQGNKEQRAVADGDLAVTSKDLAEDIKSLEGLHRECMDKASAFEAETKSRGEELEALAQAKKILEETTSGADLAQVSFVQLSAKELPAPLRAVHIVRRLADAHNSPALAQLATRAEAVAGLGGGEDVFSKVKGLIRDMMNRLEDEAAADASKKAYCDKELKESTAKKTDKETEVESLTTKMDRLKAQSTTLKNEIATLQRELAVLAKAQKELSDLREKEHAEYAKNKPVLEQGREGIKLALKVLREYYSKEGEAHEKSSGGASGIIGLLEVAEADLTRGLSELVTEEERAQAEYDEETKQNEVTKATKDQDVNLKTKQVKSIEKTVADQKSDLDNVNEELAAIMEYLGNIRKDCSGNVESYEERTANREKELAGLKEALGVLGGEAMLLQRSSRHTAFLANPERRRQRSLSASA